MRDAKGMEGDTLASMFHESVHGPDLITLHEGTDTEPPELCRQDNCPRSSQTVQLARVPQLLGDDRHLFPDGGSLLRVLAAKRGEQIGEMSLCTDRDGVAVPQAVSY